MDNNYKKNKKFIIPEKEKNFNWRIFRNHCIDEINQNDKLARNLVHKILYSRRLLIDHVESLEHCLPPTLNEKDKVDTELFTFCNTALIASATVIQKILTPKSLKFTVIPLSIITSGFCCIYLAKKCSHIRIKYIEKDLDKLIDTIDKYGNCIKRNVSYFNEILVNNATDLIEPHQMERAWDCITSIKEVIDILYEATRKLEKNYELPLKYHSYYYPMEELRDSEYFTRNITEYTYKNIKDFYNIFAYVQSQFLHRLAFTLLNDTSISFLRQDVSEIEMAITQHIIEDEQYFNNLSIEIKRKQQIESATFYKHISYPMKSGPLAVLRESSLNLCACIIGVAEECQKLDVILQKINIDDNIFPDTLKPYNTDRIHILEVANCMRGIEASLSFCCDDFNRLMLIYNRYIGSKLSNDEKNNQIIQGSDIDETSDSLTTINTKSNNNNNNDNDECDDEEKDDDYYAYFCDELTKLNQTTTITKNCEKKQQQSSPSTEIELIDFNNDKINKNKFKPVLQQLKITINPIREKMLEQERKILLAKGINVDQFLQEDQKNNLKINKNVTDNNNIDDESGSSSISSDDEIDSELKIHNKIDDKFTEMRNFLAQKQAMDIFGGTLPNRSAITEDILE